jgi:RHS repeat-associated protein
MVLSAFQPSFGQYIDEETNLYYNWNRYYDPTLGRYITSDPIGFEGGINSYSYVQNRPVISIDSRGLKDQKRNQSNTQDGFDIKGMVLQVLSFCETLITKKAPVLPTIQPALEVISENPEPFFNGIDAFSDNNCLSLPHGSDEFFKCIGN